MIVLLFVLNAAISAFNAWGCGLMWDSTKAKGGGAHFMTWMGAVMSACGFTWCYLVVLGFGGAILPMSLIDKEAEAGVMLLDAASLQAFFDLGYIVIIFPILGSGLAIMLSSWRSFARRRSFGSGAVAGWNTFAQVHNTYQAVKHIPGVLERLGGFFGGGSKGSGGKKDARLLVVLLVVVALVGGVLTTYAIIQAKRRAVLLDAVVRAA